MRIGSLAGPLELGGDYCRWVQAARSDQAIPNFDVPNQPAPNVGDWFVTKIVDRLIDFDEVLTMTPASSAKDWDEFNETCAVVLLNVNAPSGPSSTADKPRVRCASRPGRSASVRRELSRLNAS